jgi:ABC-2 type transport system permease protein
MFTILRKELNAFLYSLTGYLVMGVFLLASSLFLWIFPGTYNIPDSGYASIDPLFMLSPWLFMFLMPAITMRSFAEEIRTGTLELLLTKPIGIWQLISGKYLATIALLGLCLIPTLISYYAVAELGAPQNNVDTGAMWGSYIGLLLLGAAYGAIGIFASAITSNQIVAFVIGVFLSFFFYVGFESLSSLHLFGIADYVFIKMGMNEHYISLSRGVIDSRDMIYFLSLILLFLVGSKILIEHRRR